MSIEIKYAGTQQRWPELSITGKQSVWMPGQIEERDDVEAGKLLATGLFTSEPVDVKARSSAQGVVNIPYGLISAASALTYDSSGRVATRTDGRGVWTLTYDTAGRLLTESCADVTRTHSYGTDGRWTGMVEA